MQQTNDSTTIAALMSVPSPSHWLQQIAAAEEQQLQRQQSLSRQLGY
jgi:hypothetical protein